MVWRKLAKDNSSKARPGVLRKSSAQGQQPRNSNSKIKGSTSQALMRRMCVQNVIGLEEKETDRVRRWSETIG